eukprot:TRINITY_DN2683_c0_g1_i1.p1 TRINITY_DN2683_c0_g1~~TRINITY_DN2683_c0_g1_i1.p1  ORF type:complete len:372 (+),score=90.34 TRINITY_DN2683_c0_g1_i1:461-1576(+)
MEPILYDSDSSYFLYINFAFFSPRNIIFFLQPVLLILYLQGLYSATHQNQPQNIQQQQQVQESPKKKFTPPSIPGSHPHSKHVYEQLLYWEPVNFQTGDLLKIKEKLLSNIKKHSNTINNEELNILNEIFSSLESKSSINQNNNNSKINALIERISNSLPYDDIFPFLDLVRLMVLHNTEVARYLTNEGFQTFSLLLKKLTDQSSSKAARIMILRLAANILATDRDIGLNVVSNNEKFKIFLDGFVNGINVKDDNQTKAASAVLVYNISLYLPFSQITADSDETTQCISSIVHHLPQESDRETQYTLLMALGHLLYGNDDGVSIVQVLGFDVGLWLSESSSSSSSSSNSNTASLPPKLVSVAKDIQNLLSI